MTQFFFDIFSKNSTFAVSCGETYKIQPTLLSVRHIIVYHNNDGFPSSQLMIIILFIHGVAPIIINKNFSQGWYQQML